MGMPTSDELARNGYLGAKALLSKPSLTLVGVLDAKGTPIGTPAYGAKIGELFAGGDRLMRAADLGCEPGAKWLFGQSLNGELYQRHTGSIWYPNVSRRRGYACSKIQGDALDITRMNTVQVFPSPRERREVKKDFGMVGLTGTVTARMTRLPSSRSRTSRNILASWATTRRGACSRRSRTRSRWAGISS